MSASSVIPHSLTREQPHVSDELHILLEQLSDSELAALAAVILACTEPDRRSPADAAAVLTMVRNSRQADPARLLADLAEFSLLLVAARSHRRADAIAQS